MFSFFCCLTGGLLLGNECPHSFNGLWNLMFMVIISKNKAHNAGTSQWNFNVNGNVFSNILERHIGGGGGGVKAK